LINDLLAFSRVGRSNLEFETVDLNQVVHDATDMVSGAIQDANAQVQAADLPIVKGEISLLIALFQNLIANAVKFRREDVPPVVDITTIDLGDAWQFAVKDNGIGIDQAYAERIFVIFQRLHGRDEYGGTGIGLAMCKKIVEYHSGKIWLDDQSGQGSGTVFKFTLPKHQLPK
jgi:light-regulated signal transduction histidine kinase (bacteriophytochrome)